MKKILAIGLVVALTGCGTVEHVVKQNFMPSVDLAKEECAKMGFNYGTPNYQLCVMRQTESIRSARATANNNAWTAMPRTITCGRVGSYVQCDEH